MEQLTDLEKFCFAFAGMNPKEYAERLLIKWEEYLKENEINNSNKKST